MKVCFFGIYNPNYSRNRVLIRGLKENGVEIIECNTKLKGIKKYLDLIKKHWSIRNKYDIMMVGFPGQQSMILARFLTRKKIIFDAFTSLYDSLVLDRKIVERKSWKAKYYWFLDWLSCRLANKILLDTNEHIKYFVKTFKIPKEKFIRVFVGADHSSVAINNIDNIKEDKKFIVCFYGSYIPLQGVEYIIEASKILKNKDKDIQFNIIGSKIKKKFEDDNLQNVNFIDNLNYSDLLFYIKSADVSLGIFGNTEKAQRVIPNKIYDAIAVGSAVITADTPAIRELFTNRENIFLCRISNPSDLVEKIIEIKHDRKLRVKIANNAYRLFQTKLLPQNIVRSFLKIISSY